MGQRRMAMVKQADKPSRFDVYLVNLDPTHGSEIKKTRPCVIISPDELNHCLTTVVVAPMTTKERNYPTRISLTFAEKKGQIVLDQIRTLDQVRLIKRLGNISKPIQKKVLTTLQEMFTL
jgi:mRNA interferase MazF